MYSSVCSLLSPLQAVGSIRALNKTIVSLFVTWLIFCNTLMCLLPPRAEVEPVGEKETADRFSTVLHLSHQRLGCVTDSPLSWLIHRFHFSRLQSQYLILHRTQPPIGLGIETLRWREERMRIWELPLCVHSFIRTNAPARWADWPAVVETHRKKPEKLCTTCTSFNLHLFVHQEQHGAASISVHSLTVFAQVFFFYHLSIHFRNCRLSFLRSIGTLMSEQLQMNCVKFHL